MRIAIAALFRGRAFSSGSAFTLRLPLSQHLYRCYDQDREAQMLDIKKDIQAMTTFRRNPAKFVKHLKKTKRPLILTINGKAEAVLQDAEAYQRLLDTAARADACEGVRQAKEDVKSDRTRPARRLSVPSASRL